MLLTADLCGDHFLGEVLVASQKREVRGGIFFLLLLSLFGLTLYKVQNIMSFLGER